MRGLPPAWVVEGERPTSRTERLGKGRGVEVAVAQYGSVCVLVSVAL